MDGKFIAFVVFGSLFLLASYLAYLVVVAGALLSTVIFIGMIQSKLPIIATKNPVKAILYSTVWALLGVTIMFCTAIALVPAEHGFEAWMMIGRGLDEKNAYSLFTFTFAQFFIVASVTSIGLEHSKPHHQALRALIILTLVGAFQGIGQFESGDFQRTFLGEPLNVAEAAAQGAFGSFLVPLDLAVIFGLPEHNLREMILSKYAIDPFNPFSYTSLIGALVWIWAIVSVAFRIRPSFGWMKKGNIDEQEFWSNVPLYLGIFLVCNVVAFQGLATVAALSSDNYIAQQNINIVGFLSMIPSPFAMIGVYALLFYAPLALLNASGAYDSGFNEFKAPQSSTDQDKASTLPKAEGESERQQAQSELATNSNELTLSTPGVIYVDASASTDANFFSSLVWIQPTYPETQRARADLGKR